LLPHFLKASKKTKQRQVLWMKTLLKVLRGYLSPVP
jgi:hypothetical protein